MNKLAILASVTLLAASAVSAQPAAGASGPRGGMMGPRFGDGVTPGWGMMSNEERAQHRKAMSEAKTQAECSAERERMHKLMSERAKERGHAMPAAPGRDVCAGLKP